MLAQHGTRRNEIVALWVGRFPAHLLIKRRGLELGQGWLETVNHILRNVAQRCASIGDSGENVSGAQYRLIPNNGDSSSGQVPDGEIRR